MSITKLKISYRDFKNKAIPMFDLNSGIVYSIYNKLGIGNSPEHKLSNLYYFILKHDLYECINSNNPITYEFMHVMNLDINSTFIYLYRNYKLETILKS